jgi:SAM-dependent methyltransferase
MSNKLIKMEFYKTAADDFSRTRTTMWPGVAKFLSSIPFDSLILDAGCGNGKNMTKTPHNFIGLDTCTELLNIISSKLINPVTKISIKSNIVDLVTGSVDNLPFPNETFDATMSVAVIHHLNSFNSRLNAFKELIRVCKPGGKILITVWQMESNPKYIGGSEYIGSSEVETTNTEPTYTEPINTKPTFIGDRLIRWKQQYKGQTVDTLYRFYHFYSEDEIKYVISYCEENLNVKANFRVEEYNYHIEFEKLI